MSRSPLERNVKFCVTVALSVVTFSLSCGIVMEANAAEAIGTGVIFSAEETEQSAKASAEARHF